MWAVRIHGHGDPEQLAYERVAVPKGEPGEVIVRVEAAGLNHSDIWLRQGARGAGSGRQPTIVQFPRVLGSDVAGVIVSTGPGSRSEFPAAGDRVLLHPARGCGTCARCLENRENDCDSYSTLGYQRDGGYAQYIAVPSADCLPIPAHLDLVEAACLPISYMTAWHLLVHRLRLRAGETVLITAAASGVGLALVQLAVARGATVIASASSEEKLGYARAAGASETIDYASSDLLEATLSLTNGVGVDAAIDSLGSESFLAATRAVRRGGRVGCFGATTGAEISINLYELMARRLTLHFTVMGTRSDLVEVLREIEQRKLRPVVRQVFPLAKASEAHALLEARSSFGKLVLVPPSAAI